MRPKRRGKRLGLASAVLLAVWAVALGAAQVSSEQGRDRLVVADLRGNALLVVDASSLSVTQRIGLPGGPHELLELPDGRVLVSIEQHGLLVAVDLDSGAIEVIEVGGIPHGLALDHGMVLVTDRQVNAIRRFTVGGWEEETPIPTGRWPHAVRVTSAGEIAVATAADGRLEVGAHRIAIGETTETLDVRSDGHIAVAAATDGVVAVYDSALALEGRWDLAGRPVRVLFSPDGTTLAVALSATGAVAFIDAAGARELPVAGVPDGLAFTPDGSRVYVSDVFGGALTVLDIASGKARVIDGLGQSTGAILVVDGSRRGVVGRQDRHPDARP